MKVCIVGTGNQGTGMAGLLAQESDCKELILVDILLEKAQKAEALVRSMGERCNAEIFAFTRGTPPIFSRSPNLPKVRTFSSTESMPSSIIP